MARPITLARPRLQKVGKVGLENQRLALRQAAECALSHVGAKLQQPSNAKVALRARGSPPNEARCMGFAGHKMYQTARMIEALGQKSLHHGHLSSRPRCAAADPGKGQRRAKVRLRQSGAGQCKKHMKSRTQRASRRARAGYAEEMGIGTQSDQDPQPQRWPQCESSSERVTLLRTSPPNDSRYMGLAGPLCRRGQKVPKSKDDPSSEAESVPSWGHLFSHPRCAAAEPGEGRMRRRGRLRLSWARQWNIDT